ncbi:MAG: UDP-glucose/iron transport system ATP-binding protein [Thiomicrorhabdus sp.]|nr:MAG: UDP-glucose/iron transport system ATP-binding protein [Thiomicrorhabdus sp.]
MLSDPLLLSVQDLQVTGLNSPVNLSVTAGQVWMISGPSGSGKSQALKALADLIPHQGEVMLNGQNLQNIPPEKWRSQVMYFPAETAWWSDCIADHFETLPDDKQLASIGLSATIMQKNPDECSSGEKQRLALLRGLSRLPIILLLDEITANLDTEAAMRVERLLKDYLKQHQSESNSSGAIIWVSHDVAQRQRMAPSEQQLMLKSETPPTEKIEL